MPLQSFAATDKGRVRKRNEDSLFADDDLGLFMVADGLGGQQAGDFASQLAVRTVSEFIISTHPKTLHGEQADDDPSSLSDYSRLQAAFALANNAIVTAADLDVAKKKMGTTATCALIRDRFVQIAHCGDSRIYLLRNEELLLLSQDHTWVNEQVVHGLLTKKQARRHPYRNVVINSLGSRKAFNPDFSHVTLQHGDILLLCSDGLTEMIDEDEISALISKDSDRLDRVVLSLVKLANDKGGSDNITVILVGYNEA